MPIVVVLIGVPLIFPDGHLLSTAWRWIVVLCVAASPRRPSRDCSVRDRSDRSRSPTRSTCRRSPRSSRSLDAFSSWTSIIGFGAAVLAVVIRYRRGDEVERHQLKWLIAVAVVAGDRVPDRLHLRRARRSRTSRFVIGLLALFALPVVIAIAILRYRLYDIDRIVSRTISWGLVTGMLVALFAVVVIALQGLLAAAHPGPRRRVHPGPDPGRRRVDPRRVRLLPAGPTPGPACRRPPLRPGAYDADRTATAFAHRLRDEVDLDTLATDLRSTVAQAVRPSSATIWLASGGRR